MGQRKADISRSLSVSGILLERGGCGGGGGSGGLGIAGGGGGYGVGWVRGVVRGVPRPF